MATPINNILNWFKTGLKPTQAQFWASWQSFWHKDETIPQDKIENLQQSFDDKLDVEALPAIRPVIIVNGNPFTLVKNPNNNNPANAKVLETNDFISSGTWDGTEYWDLAIALGTDKDNKTNWNVLKSTEEIPLI